MKIELQKKMLAQMEEQTKLLKSIHDLLLTNSLKSNNSSELMRQFQSCALVMDSELEEFDELTQTVSFTSKNNQKGYFAFNKESSNKQSNCIKTVVFKDNCLFLTFKNSNDTYVYNSHKVNMESLFKQLVSAPSIGKAFHKLVLKNNSLQFNKL